VASLRCWVPALLLLGRADIYRYTHITLPLLPRRCLVIPGWAYLSVPRWKTPTLSTCALSRRDTCRYAVCVCIRRVRFTHRWTLASAFALRVDFMPTLLKKNVRLFVSPGSLPCHLLLLRCCRVRWLEGAAFTLC